MPRTWMKNGSRKVDVTEVPRTFSHSFTTRLALEVPVNGTHSRVHETTHLRFVSGLVHDLGVFDFGYRVRFLRGCEQLPVSLRARNSNSNTYNFLWRENTKLYFLHFADWRR
jgi:hypothetical protein